MLTAVFVLIVAFIIPPHQAVIQVFEAYVNMYFFAALSWAWVCRIGNGSSSSPSGLSRHLRRQQGEGTDRSLKDSGRRGAIVSAGHGERGTILII